MCLIAWNWQPDSERPFLLAANRDEFFARPALPLHWWQDGRILAGRDLHGGGTWLGMTRCGRVAALTNFRDPANQRHDAPSRGRLVADFLAGTASASEYLQQLTPHAQHYNPFNLLLLDGQHLMGFESNKARSFALTPGVHGVSNADFDTPWPKLVRLKQALAQLRPVDERNSLMDALQDQTIAADGQLPRTGIALERERLLSAAFIQSADYGTRASSIIRIDAQGAHFYEHTFDAGGSLATQQFVTAPP